MEKTKNSSLSNMCDSEAADIVAIEEFFELYKNQAQEVRTTMFNIMRSEPGINARLLMAHVTLLIRRKNGL
jgi:predicted RNase H-like nuclease (RuvC/YqgF family)